MSILSDLDPKNVRLQADTSHAFPSWAKWSLVLLLLLAGSVWLYHTTLNGKDTSHPSSDPMAASPESMANVATAQPFGVADSNRIQEPSPPNNNGSAVIRVSEGDMAFSMPKAEATDRATDLDEPARSTLQTPSLKMAEVSDAKNPSPSRPLAKLDNGVKKKQVAPVKRIQKKATTMAGKTKSPSVATIQKPQDSTSKDQERDVDIISAMVR